METMKPMGNLSYSSDQEKQAREKLASWVRSSPVPQDQILENLGLFLDSKALSRVLFLDFIYRQILETHGVVFEFGTRWGQNIALFESLRGIYEPFFRHRKLVAFDTFEGFPSVTEKDGRSKLMKKGNLTVTPGYDQFLNELLQTREQLNPLSHIPKFEIVKGDASVQLKKYFQQHPETIVALAYFDLDLYKPTKDCLQILKGNLTRGSVLVFDELCDPDSPGETEAVKEVLGLDHGAIKRWPHASRVSYMIWEGNSK